jgi:hypothetical protein
VDTVSRRRGKNVRGPVAAPVATRARPTTIQANDPASSATTIARALAGGRATTDTSATLFPSLTPAWIAPETPEDTWRVLDLDADALGKFPPWRILELLVDLSPDVSRALFDFVNFCNPGWTIAAYNVGTTTVSRRAIAAIKAFLDVLHARYGSVDIVWNRLFLNTWLRGAIFMELVLDKDGRTPLDLATPDPQSARFRKRPDAALGEVWDLGQLQGVNGFVDLSQRATVRYLPLHPLPGVPYGRPLAASALFTALFFLGILHDIRRVVAQQGYPRIDIAVDFEAMQAAMPADAADDPDLFAQWVSAALSEVIAKYKQLQPDDAYVHASTISVNKPVGAVDADSLGGITGLIAALERALGKALKTMPLIGGTTDGVSEANANRQTEIFLLGINGIQNLVETGLEWLFTLMLRAQGIAADVVFEFDEQRATEEMRDEQVLQLKLTNAKQMYDLGFVDIDEAAQHAVAHNADQRTMRTEQRAEQQAAQQAKVGKVTGDVLPPGANDKKEKKRRREAMTQDGLIVIGGGNDGRTARSAGD